jgi:hypothetical protein
MQMLALTGHRAAGGWTGEARQGSAPILLAAARNQPMPPGTT